MYGVGGERLLPESELVTLDGYRSSSPVRIGNAAAEQFQLDVSGYLLDTAWLYHRAGGEITASFWGLLAGVVEVVAARWQLPDEGIWEVRGGARQFVSSKLMAWVAVDRAIRLARARRLPADLDRWTALRSEIRRSVVAEGVDAATGASSSPSAARRWTRPTCSSRWCASCLRRTPASAPPSPAPRPSSPPAASSTGTSRATTGFPGGRRRSSSAASGWSTTWRWPARPVEHGSWSQRLLGCANDVGLLAEEVDPLTGELLGNFPQAFSHVGLIGAALNLARAERSDHAR